MPVPSQLYGRTKSLFSTMKKLLGLGHMTRGGRERQEVFDMIGIRAVVQPRADLPPDTAEQAAVQVGALIPSCLRSRNTVVLLHKFVLRFQSLLNEVQDVNHLSIRMPICGLSADNHVVHDQACYVVDDVAKQLWTAVDGRAKDYIAEAKPNGYQSLHTTLRVASVTVELPQSSTDEVLVGNAADDGELGPGPTLELQIRTAGEHGGMPR